MSSVGREECLLLEEKTVSCWKTRMSSVGRQECLLLEDKNVFWRKTRMSSAGREEYLLLTYIYRSPYDPRSMIP